MMPKYDDYIKAVDDLIIDMNTSIKIHTVMQKVYALNFTIILAAQNGKLSFAEYSNIMKLLIDSCFNLCFEHENIE